MAPENKPGIEEDHLLQCLRVLQDTRATCISIIEQDRERQLAAASSPATEPQPTESTPSQLVERQKAQKRLFSSLAWLRGQHRNAYTSLRQTKQITAEAKQEQDRLHLQLQNLYYEQRHLRGEIDSCLEFPHTYMTIPLVPTEEFLERHPEHTDKDPHDLMKERLFDERTVREELEAQRKQLVAKKQALIAENKRKKDDLASLDEHLKKFIESSKPIQQTFEKEY